MPRRRRDNGLSLTMFALFLLFLIGQSIAGWKDFNEDQVAHGQQALAYAHYLTTGHFWEAVSENWESEFLQMAAYVLLTAYLFQRGSSESKDPDNEEPVDEDPALQRDKPGAPWPVRRGGIALVIYNHSLSLALTALFLMSFAVHGASGAKEYSRTQRQHGQPEMSMSEYMTTPHFWHESFQNWQSEFLAVGVLVVLSIWLREKGSPESKPVASAHEETGDN